MKHSLKKIITLLISVLLLASIALATTGCCFPASDSDSGTGTNNNSGTANNAGSSNNDNVLGNYKVEIDSCRLASNYSGDAIVIVKYIFTNVSDESPSSFSSTVSDEVYQGGIGLNECYFAADSANYSSDNQYKEIKKGASLEVEVAYELNDTTTDIEVEVSEWLSFSNKTVTKTFKIAA